AGHARRPPGRRGVRRPEARRDAGGGDRRRRRLSRHRAADHAGPRPAPRRRDRRRRLTATFAALAIHGPDASLAPQLREPLMPKSYVITRVDILDPEA